MNDLSVLEKHRDALLLAEIAAWLHMLGKFQEKFLTSDHKDRNSRDLDINIPDEVPGDLRALLEETWTGDVWNTLPFPKNLQAKRLSIFSFIKRHRRFLKRGTEGFIQLLIDAHGRGSGIEKGVLNRFFLSHQNPVYMSTSLGYETAIDSVGISQAQRDLYKFLKEHLNLLKINGAKLSREDWLKVQKTFEKNMDQYFSNSVAETRRPVNDVTLLDQTIASVAFFKSALAYNLLLGTWKEPVATPASEQYRWRLLRIGIDDLAFLGNSLRISDVLSRKKCIKEALNIIQALLEIDYPLGTEVYRDENGSVFIVPDIADLLEFSAGSRSLKQHIQDIAHKAFDGETLFTLLPTARTRDVLNFGSLVTEALPLPQPQIAWLQQQWKSRINDNCPVCGLRPQGPGKKASQRNICDVCEKRRIDRSSEWIKNPTTTIWIDEVADQHGQLALLVARFDMAEWLKGYTFNTILSFDPESRRLIDTESALGEYDFDLRLLNENIQNALNLNQQFKDDLLGELVLKNVRGGLDTIKDFYDLRVTNTDIGAAATSPDLGPELLTLSLIRQQPSFTRIRRTWETTRRFWEDVTSNFEHTIGQITMRIKIRGNFLASVNSTIAPIRSHTYELKLGAVSLSITCTDVNEFLTVENLQHTAMLLGASGEFSANYVAAANYVVDYLRSGNGTFRIEEPTGYSNPNRTLGNLEIIESSIESGSSYLPAIAIVVEPSTFMAVVPADKVWNVAKYIKEKYEIEMGKVRNRLPMALGIVFADRRTPLPAILDAGRRMLKQPLQANQWAVGEKDGTTIDPTKVELTLKRNDSSLKLQIPVVMGDGTTEDAWYPYWCVEADKDGNQPEKRKRQFTSIEGKQWIHVSDLAKGDTVYLCPSRFDFELLDTAARRFEVSYAGGKRRSGMRPARPYYLEQLDSFEQLWELLSKHLAISQIDNLIGLIETKRQEWLIQQDDDVFQQAVKDILHNANWQGELLSCSEFEQFAHAAGSGQLSDVVELFITILKEKTRVDLIGGTK